MQEVIIIFSILYENGHKKELRRKIKLHYIHIFSAKYFRYIFRLDKKIQHYLEEIEGKENFKEINFYLTNKNQ